MSRCQGADRYRWQIKYLGFVILVCFLVWLTPHTIAMTPSELRLIGSQYHPLVAPLGLMPAKNTAVNILIICTFLSFVVYRRSARVPTVAWARAAAAVQGALIAAGALNIVYLGVYYGYYTNTVYKVASSVPQVLTTLLVITGVSAIEFFAYRGARSSGPFMWGRVPARSQYALLLLAVSFTWLMGLMGFIRSAIRQHWHVYSVVRDASSEAFTPRIGYAVEMVSAGTVVFLSLIVFIFWLNQRRGEERLKW